MPVGDVDAWIAEVGAFGINSIICLLTYDVSFPMFSKVDVNGDHAHPLFKYLKDEAPGLLGSRAITW